MTIKHALKAIQEEKYQNAIIISDSKTAISAINNTYSTNNTILNILELHEKLTHNGTKTEILWIPSHIGIGGNEKADLAAKDATTNPSRGIHGQTSRRPFQVHKKKTGYKLGERMEQYSLSIHQKSHR